MAVPPPATLVGVTVSDERVEVGANTVTFRVAVRVAPPSDPVSVTCLSAVTAVVVTLNVAVVAPDGTMTLGGTVAVGSELTRPTRVPPAGAAALKVTVPVAVPPPWTLVGATLTEVSVTEAAGARTINVAVLLTPPSVAVRIAGVSAVTAAVAMSKVALVVAAGTVTLAGTVADGSALESVTTVSPVAGKSRVTVPVAVPPP